MNMHNPPHPGEFIRQVYLEPYGITSRQVAKKLKVSPSTFIRLINGESNVSPEMAIRLSRVLGRTPESWLTMQDNYSLWVAKKKIDLSGVEKLELATD
ncbi:MAG: HigA family addiction module antidote protein [Candidatus Marinimicrobia bacterium]|nr:HigA family addiction module antidote protein [Candidatus Neomarinimicrobiota bacterium]MCF7840587.1 HigA family addiction module antidote protein [Candidatus Neomarinimicrobiota bacterium]